MRFKEIISESGSLPIKNQIIADVRKQGGNQDDYFVRFTNTDKLGFSNRQTFGFAPDVDDPEFDVDRISAGDGGRRVLWFYPLKYYLKSVDNTYGAGSPYVWLVKLKADAWLQPVKRGDNKIKQSPIGKRRVGMLRMSDPPAALFFEPGFELIGRYFDYAGQHKRHGNVKGRPTPSFFDRIRGNA